VRTYPGDWAKPVEAIDIAERGDVIVIDAGGVRPAVWGELATHSAIQKGLAGTVIDGALRDTYDICKLKFPAFSRLIAPNAGEPKGFGEIGVPVTSKLRPATGSWEMMTESWYFQRPRQPNMRTVAWTSWSEKTEFVRKSKREAPLVR